MKIKKKSTYVFKLLTIYVNNYFINDALSL